MPTTQFTKPILCYVTDRHSLQAESHGRCATLLEQIRRAAEAGVDWIQLREKDLQGRALCGLVKGALNVTNGRGSRSTRIIVNDRLDAALAAGAAGVHLGEQSLPVAAVAGEKCRRIPDDFLIGVSCHSATAARQAELDGAGYIFFGPVFVTPSKAAFGAPQGLAQLGVVCGAVSIPVIAIGGITGENAGSCLDAGASGVAAIRLFQQTRELSAVTAAMRGKAQA